MDLRATTPVRLSRSSTDRVVLGVAGGMGERMGVDPIVVRLGFGLLVLAGGIGFVLYLVGILVSVDAMRPVQQVSREILTALDQLRPLLDHAPGRAGHPADLAALGEAFGAAGPAAGPAG